MLPGGRFFVFFNKPLILAVCKIVALFLLLGPQIGNLVFMLFIVTHSLFFGMARDALLAPLLVFPFGIVFCYWVGIAPALLALGVWLFAWAIGRPFRSVWWYSVSYTVLVIAYVLPDSARIVPPFGVYIPMTAVISAFFCHRLARRVYVGYSIRMAGVPVTGPMRAQF